MFVDGDFGMAGNFPSGVTNSRRNGLRRSTETGAGNRRNFARLRRQGWLVLRVWEHDVLSDLEGVADRIESAVRGRSTQIGSPTGAKHGPST